MLTVDTFYNCEEANPCILMYPLNARPANQLQLHLTREALMEAPVIIDQPASAIDCIGVHNVETMDSSMPF